mmetsp:Transcript_5456/g.19777  ORF Transcript_5456/g.19777 Transcript_5456/m.19777 type:complete len:214 (+) Transcript_5456:997-1638(+)
MYFPVSVVKESQWWNFKCSRMTAVAVRGVASSAYMHTKAWKHMESKMSMAATASCKSTPYFWDRSVHLHFDRGGTETSQASQTLKNSAKAVPLKRKHGSDARRPFGFRPTLEDKSFSTFSGISMGEGRPSRNEARLQALISMLDSALTRRMAWVHVGAFNARESKSPSHLSSEAPTVRIAESTASARPAAPSPPAMDSRTFMRSATTSRLPEK